MMLSPHPMDHAQKRALQGTNEITGLGLRPLRLPSYTPACFWPDAPRPSSCTPLKTYPRELLVWRSHSGNFLRCRPRRSPVTLTNECGGVITEELRDGTLRQTNSRGRLQRPPERHLHTELSLRG